MTGKVPAGLFGGLLGLLTGLLGGGFLGLVLGGTFLGWLEIPGYPFLTGYELAAYLGAAAGVLITTPLGVVIALAIVKGVQKEKPAR